MKKSPKKIKATTQNNVPKNSLLDTAKELFGENHFISLVIAFFLSLDIDKKEVLQPGSKEILKALGDKIPNDFSPMFSGDFFPTFSKDSLLKALNNFVPNQPIDVATFIKFWAMVVDLLIERAPIMIILSYGQLLIEYFIQFPESTKILSDMLAKAESKKKETFNFRKISFTDKKRPQRETLNPSGAIILAPSSGPSTFPSRTNEYWKFSFLQPPPLRELRQADMNMIGK